MFMAWLDQHKARLEQRGVDVIVTLPDRQTDNNSVCANFDTVGHIARITFWEAGLCDIEVIEINSEQLVFWQHYEFSAWNEAERIVSEFITILVAKTI